ncbi:nucleoside hydrolase [Actinopolymorpha alba]|uniref:nucleoside hydrolase n=1 Tax=Actinopolymorpha alba TaxID=533267 RepID=UPI0003801053|nr:nucleoside hydrolase [Actinopolymorpha alba]
MRIHLDTDLGGDPDDACALAMLLGWPGVELLGITTVLDPAGVRAGYVRHLLELAGRADIPVAAGAGASLTTGQLADPVIGDPRYWPASAHPTPSPPGAALDLLSSSVEAGATVVAIGPCTNLAILATCRPGSLAETSVVMMGGWVRPPAAGLPAWGPDQDWNVQWDTRAASIVMSAVGCLTLTTLPATLGSHLRASDLPRLRAAGPLGVRLASQAAAYGEDAGMTRLGHAHTGLPGDLLNFHYDPVTCAVALGWPGATVEEMNLRPDLDGGVLRFVPDENGIRTRVLVDVDGPGFTEVWLRAVEAASTADAAADATADAAAADGPRPLG